MIKIYGTMTCHDCAALKTQIEGNDNYQFIDICANIRTLKSFIQLRDKSPIFDNAKRYGAVGIPCFELEDGSLTLSPEAAGLQAEAPTGKACNIDGSGC